MSARIRARCDLDADLRVFCLSLVLFPNDDFRNVFPFDTNVYAPVIGSLLSVRMCAVTVVAFGGRYVVAVALQARDSLVQDDGIMGIRSQDVGHVASVVRIREDTSLLCDYRFAFRVRVVPVDANGTEFAIIECFTRVEVRCLIHRWLASFLMGGVACFVASSFGGDRHIE